MMTRDEIIKEYEAAVAAHAAAAAAEIKGAAKSYELFKAGLSALRPVSREQVEKVCGGCEKCNGAGEYSRYAENLTKTLLAKYCPHCGRPLTDEAVEMVMERMEALENDN